MLAEWEGRKRIDIAKEVLSNMVDSLASNPNVQLGLRVYGHEWDKKFGNCKDTKLISPFAPNNHRLIKQKLAEINPQGVTPIAYSLLESSKDFPIDNTYRNVIIIITDGLESCAGDPCAVSTSLQKKNIFLSPFIIGIGLEEDLSKHFECIGKFINASNVSGFKMVLSQVITRSITAETNVKVELLSQDGKNHYSDVNMTFINSLTQLPMYDFVHFQENGKTDVVNVDPVLTYDILVNTIPSTLKRNNWLELGKENVIKIKTPQGILETKMNGAQEYHNLTVLLKDPRNGEVIHSMNINQHEKIIAGIYDVEVLTLPRTVFKKVKIEEHKTTTLTLESPGRVSVPDTRQGFGSLYKLNQDGTEEWIYNMDPNNSQLNVAIQPGDYKLVFRDKNAIGNRFTFIKRFKIKQGASTAIKLFY